MERILRPEKNIDQILLFYCFLSRFFHISFGFFYIPRIFYIPKTTNFIPVFLISFSTFQGFTCGFYLVHILNLLSSSFSKNMQNKLINFGREIRIPNGGWIVWLHLFYAVWVCFNYDFVSGVCIQIITSNFILLCTYVTYSCTFK